MNIAYAVKIFAALAVVAWMAKLLAGPGLRHLLSPKDYKMAWWGIVGTLAVSCFSLRIELFFMILPVWALILSHMLGKHGEGRLPAYVLLACVSPPFSLEIEHVGPLNDLLQVTPLRILSIFILLPEGARLLLRRRTGPHPGWLTLCDVATIAYAFYWVVRHFTNLTISTIGRESLGQVLDSLLPYYVLTRTCVQDDVRRRVLAFLLLAASFVALVGIIESATGHYLFSQLQWLYSAPWGLGAALMRGSWLRAQASLTGPLPLSVLMLFAIGIWFALKEPERNRRYDLILLGLVAGLLATFGRGSIIAATILFLSLWLLRRTSVRTYLVLTAIAVVGICVGWQAGLGDIVSNIVISAAAGDATAEFNYRYREELLATSLALLRQSPWLGVPNFLSQMQNLRQGEGIIDLVNTYLVIALNSGLFGIAMVFTPFLVTLQREAGRLAGSDRVRREGRVWVAMTVAILVAIFSVSPVSIVQPVMIWTVAFALARLQSARVAHSANPYRSAHLNAAHPGIGQAR